jgi:Flp pilus assembly pilin Flp
MRAVLRALDLVRAAPVDWRARSTGQGLVEYGLILSLIVLVAVISLVFFGDQVAAALQLIGDEIDRASS